MLSRTLVAALAATCIAAAPAAAQTIQPGAAMQSGDSLCTMGFVYDGGGKVYVGTAAHCVGGVGDDVADERGVTFGDVAFIGDEDATETDYAFVQVRPEHVGRVSAAMKGHPTVPRSGFTRSGETSLGDVVLQSGYGTVVSLFGVTREQRRSLLMYDDPELYTVLGLSLFGDSGGPLVHQRTGRALGIVSRLCIGTCQSEGPTVEGLLAKAAARGFVVQLRTVS